MKLSPKEHGDPAYPGVACGQGPHPSVVLRHIWGPAADVQYLRVYVRQLRQKIESVRRSLSTSPPKPASATRLREPDDITDTRLGQV